MRAEELKRTILKMFGGSELYGYDVNRRLSLQGVEVELSRLYRVLNEMRKDGLLDDRWEKSRHGPRKKMYRVSEKGREALNEILLEAIATVHRFYGEYLTSLYPEINVFGEILGLLAEGLEGHEKIAYITTKYFGIHELIVSKLKEMVPEGRIYIVKPDSLDISVNIENVYIHNGSYDDIPFKNGFVDRLMLIDLPNKEIIEEAAREWQRVVHEKGMLSIFTPTILIQKQDDPLSIGDFVEKHEHETIERGEHVDREILLSTLGSLFKKVGEKEAVHMSIISAYEPIR
ncbi:MAG: PadR family transcriptional regulator [Candidatus Bathyarchaeota archaeon]|nr:PadR family transcriptional regulator [Candidatus Bathyarchaeota archaeon]